MRKFVVITFGQSQVGKDTWIQTFLNVQTHPGQGFHSMTDRAEMYKNTIQNTEYIVINLPGLNDSNLRFENSFILEQIQAILLENNISTVNAVLLMESMVNDVSTILTCYDQIRRLFGESIQQSTLIVGCKQDLAQIIGTFERRKTQIENLSRQLNIPCTFWNNYQGNGVGLQNDIKQRNITDIIAKMNQLTPYTVERIIQIQEELIRRAQALMANTPQEIQQINVQYTEIVQIPYEDIEEYQETYQDLEPYKITKSVQKMRYETRKEMRPQAYKDKEWRVVGDQWDKKWLGTKKAKWGYADVDKIRNVEVDVQVPVIYYEDEQETLYRPVEKTRTATRAITRHRPQEEIRTKLEMVPIPHDEKVFYERVKQERVNQIRLQLSQPIVID